MKPASPDKAAPPLPPTETLLQTPEAATGTEADPPPPSHVDAPARFTPGAMLAGRYRIVSLLGKGGMGEVYRVDDVKLGVVVALKFLPRSAAGDAGRLSRFYSEVRIGRQVSHPNVCQIYDLVEVEGHHALTMEYVDGEDLASLLRRIGRLPQDKALDVARDLCAGLTAAHDKGVLHRDLKPANVMVDGRDRARITDFGLAALMAAPEEHALAGTPAYMAPEQLLGRPATERSDIFALGLVLLEAFSGRRPFAGKSLSEILAQQQDWQAPRLSSLVDGIDPAVDRMLRRCLARDPAERPATVREIAAGLPGGDQLQAALAAGRTPSPEVVAAAGQTGELTPAAGWACLAGIVGGVALVSALSGATRLYERVPLKSPEVLADRAQRILEGAGGSAPAAHRWRSFEHDPLLLRFIAQNDPSPARWQALASGRLPAIRFVYRQSPRPLVPWAAGGIVRRGDPPLTLSGMASVTLDGEGRLLELAAVPPQKLDAAAGGEPDWPVLFAEAGLTGSPLEPATPLWMPPVGFDTRRAWEGPLQGTPYRVRVEAASDHGKPTYFEVIWPWQRPLRQEAPPRRAAETVRQLTYVVLVGVATLAAALLARRNWRLGRGDRRGAFRIAVYVLLARIAAWLFKADHVPSVEQEWQLLADAAGQALFQAGQIWVFYLALEPFVRRRWPRALISWARLLAGRVQDPLVCRHVLLGALFALASQLSVHLNFLAPTFLGRPSLSPRPDALGSLAGLRFVAGELFEVQGRALFESAGILFVLVLLASAFRRRAPAFVAWLALVTVYGVMWRGESLYLAAAFSALRALVALLVVVRLGLLPLAVCGAVWYWLQAVPLTLDLSAWYADRALLALVVLAAMTVLALRGALAGRSLLPRRLLEE